MIEVREIAARSYRHLKKKKQVGNILHDFKRRFITKYCDETWIHD